MDPLHVLVLVSPEIINTSTLSFRSALRTKTSADLYKIPVEVHSCPSDPSLPLATGFFHVLRGFLSNQITHHSNLKPTASIRLCEGFSQALDQTSTLAAKPLTCLTAWTTFSCTFSK